MTLVSIHIFKNGKSSFFFMAECYSINICQFNSVQLLSHVRIFSTRWATALQGCLSNTNCRSLLRLISIESVMPSSHLILCHPLLLLPLIIPSIRVFSNESVLCIRWPKLWNFSFSISPFTEYSGLISFRMDWLDLLKVQGTIKSLLQHHSSKASILLCSAFFIVQLSHPYMTQTIRAFPGSSVVKNLPAVQETWVQSLGQEDPLEEGMATQSIILAWRTSMDGEAWQPTVHGIPKR